MISDFLEVALSRATDTRFFSIGTGILKNIDRLFEQAFGTQNAVVIADETTYRVAGEAVRARLGASPVIFPARPAPYADYKTVLELMERLRPLEAVPVVVGSGTLNDLTKLAAHLLGREYMVVATAASMDGYTSFGASITRDGFKQTMACPAPRLVLADLEVLASAPPDMNARGYGDLLGKITAGADWIVADALEVEAIEPFCWSLVQPRLKEWTGQPAQLKAGDSGAVSNLFEGLVMGGLAMQSLKSSRPASGSEHQFSHLWEMEAIGTGKPEHPHGFKVGIGTLASAALYEQLLTHDLGEIDINLLCHRWPFSLQVEQEIRAAFPIPALADKAVDESLAKYITPEILCQRLTRLKERWPSLREKLVVQLAPARQIREQLKLAGCPTDPSEIGLNLGQMRESYTKARYIRRRYTVLDLAFEVGLFSECVNELFRAGGFWRLCQNPG